MSFPAAPVALSIDRVQVTVERWREPHSQLLAYNYWKEPSAAAAVKLVIDLLSG